MGKEDIFAPEQALSGDDRVLLRRLVEEVVTLEDDMAELKKQRQGKEERRNSLREQVVAILQEHGMTSTKWDDGLSVIKIIKKYPRVPGENQEEFKAWCKENDYEGLFKIPAQTQAALLRERLEMGQPIPKYVQTFEEAALQVRGKKVVSRG